MEKKKALKQLLDREVKEAAKAFYLNCMEYFKVGCKADIDRQFVDEFRQLFCDLAKEEKGERLLVVQLSLMRAKALKKEAFYRLEAYGEEFYLGEPLAKREMQLEWLYEEYWKFCERVDKESKKYIRCFQEPELSRIKLSELYTAGHILRYLYQNALLELVHTEEFKALKVKEGFALHLGEYHGPYERLYEVNECTKRMGEIAYGLLSNYGTN